MISDGQYSDQSPPEENILDKAIKAGKGNTDTGPMNKYKSITTGNIDTETKPDEKEQKSETTNFDGQRGHFSFEDKRKVSQAKSIDVNKKKGSAKNINIEQKKKQNDSCSSRNGSIAKGHAVEVRKTEMTGLHPPQEETPRKKSMDEWVDRLSVRKQKVSVVDRIIEKKKKESMRPSLTVSADDLLDLEYHSVHASKTPLKRQEAFERGPKETFERVSSFERVSRPLEKLPMSPLLTAQEMRQRRFIDSRPKSFDSAHLLQLRRPPADDVQGKNDPTGIESSMSIDKADFEEIQTLGRRKKSKSENFCEEHRFSDNELGKRQRKIGVHGVSKSYSFCFESFHLYEKNADDKNMRKPALKASARRLRVMQCPSKSDLYLVQAYLIFITDTTDMSV